MRIRKNYAPQRHGGTEKFFFVVNDTAEIICTTEIQTNAIMLLTPKCYVVKKVQFYMSNKK